MKFGDIATRIRHDLNTGKPEKIGGLIDELELFLDFCKLEGHLKLEPIMKDIVVDLRKLMEGNTKGHALEDRLKALEQILLRTSLSDIEPAFLYQQVDVFTSLLSGLSGSVISIVLTCDFVKDLLLLFLHEKYQYVKDYGAIYRIRDLKKNDRALVICDRKAVQRLLDSNFPLQRIIYMDFRKAQGVPGNRQLHYPLILDDLVKVLGMRL